MNERRLYNLWRESPKAIESIAAHARDVAQERLEVRSEQGGGVAEEARRMQDQAVAQNTPLDVQAVEPRQEAEREPELSKATAAGPPPRGPGTPGDPRPGLPVEPDPPGIDYEATAQALDGVLDLLHEFKRGARPGQVRGVRPGR